MRRFYIINVALYWLIIFWFIRLIFYREVNEVGPLLLAATVLVIFKKREIKRLIKKWRKRYVNGNKAV